MNVQEFSEKYKVKTRRDECNDTVVSGKVGHIGEGYANGRLGMYVMLETVRKWNFVRRRLEGAGMTIKQDAETDGVAVFDPTNKKQVRLAMKVAGIKAKRQCSLEQLARLARIRPTPTGTHGQRILTHAISQQVPQTLGNTSRPK